MATYFVAATGSNTAPYDTWANAATSVQTALSAATADGDVVAIQYNGVPAGDAEFAGNTTYTVASGKTVSVVASTNSGVSDVTPTPMGSANWIGNSTVARNFAFNGGEKLYVYGITFRFSVNGIPTFNAATGSQHVYDNCLVWQESTANPTYIRVGTAGGLDEVFTIFKNCTFYYASINTVFAIGAGGTRFINCTLDPAGASPTMMFGGVGSAAGFVDIEGCNLSHATGTLIGNIDRGTKRFVFSNTRLGSGVTVLAPQTTAPSLASCEVTLYNCASDDTHYQLAHYTALGETTVSAAIYANDGAEYNSAAAKYSWKITTTAKASTYIPYESPWIHTHNETLTAITPSLEILRDGSATAYQDDEVWGEFSYQGTAGFPMAVLVNDRMTLLGTPANQATGALSASGWTGENATAWFGKLAPNASITPAEIGPLSARVCVGEPSITVYVDPQIRV